MRLVHGLHLPGMLDHLTDGELLTVDGDAATVRRTNAAALDAGHLCRAPDIQAATPLKGDSQASGNAALKFLPQSAD